MKERPIIFNSDMVRAILGGRKTQTRRIVNPQPIRKNANDIAFFENGLPLDYRNCPYGQLGDRLWVKETWRGGNDTLESVFYKASDDCNLKYGFCQCKWKPSIFMPSEFSRITLEITNVRVERLQDISLFDSLDEGYPYKTIAIGEGNIEGKRWFSKIWDKTYGQGSWDKNPWVWVIEFNRI